MRLALLQLNPTVGDLDGNVHRLVQHYHKAVEMGCELVIAPELCTTGYPPRDLLCRPGFVRQCFEVTNALAQASTQVPLVAGCVVGASGDPAQAQDHIANGAAVFQHGRIVAVHKKMLLPVYDVFDEARYFVAGTHAVPIEILGKRVALTVCEDIWNDKEYWRQPRYPQDPVEQMVQQGAELIINVSASPFDRHKPKERREMLQNLSRRHALPVVYVNQVGGNDSLIFDGRSMYVDASGYPHTQAESFAQTLCEVNTRAAPAPRAKGDFRWEPDVTAALCMGLADYMRKCGFDKAVLGLSGGIDSALTAALAVRALGSERVIGVAMPSRFSSQGSIEDAQDLARRLKIRCDMVSIEPIFQAFLGQLHQEAGPFVGMPFDVTEENLQARIRGTILMAYSNKLGALLLTTGNKSELAVGYSTLYGDMNGGLAVISDVYKTDVYALAHHLNQATSPPPIPQSTITKPPSAELRENQVDADSLPPYEELDAVLRGYIEGELGVQELVQRGLSEPLVHRVVRMSDRSEYKRRQMPLGLRVSRKAFGEGRRLPIAQRYTP